MKRVYILLAEDFECVEALAPIDVMNRAGVELKRVAVGGNLSVSSSHGLVSLMCDVLIEDADLSDGEAIILPGGNPGYINLRNSELYARLCATTMRVESWLLRYVVLPRCWLLRVLRAVAV